MLVARVVVGIVFLSLAHPAKTAAVEPHQEALRPASTVRVTVARANIRLQPTTESPVITTVSAGTVLELLEKGGDWHTVLVPGTSGELPRTGYIFSNLVEVRSTSLPTAGTTRSAEPKPAESPSPPVAQPVPVQANESTAYNIFVKGAADESGFSDQELQDSARDIRRSLDEPTFQVVTTEAEANVLLVVVKREVKVGEPSHSRVLNALSSDKANQINDVYTTVSVKRDGRWETGVKLSSNQCCGAWRAAADEVVKRAREWLEQNYRLSPSTSARSRPAEAPRLIGPGLERAVASNTATLQQSPRDQWLRELEKARKKRNRGLLITAGGMGGGFLIALLGSSGGSVGGAVFGGIVMAGSAGYGGWTYITAKNRLEDLDREGQIKGFVSVAPTPGGVFASAAISF